MTAYPKDNVFTDGVSSIKDFRKMVCYNVYFENEGDTSYRVVLMFQPFSFLSYIVVQNSRQAGLIITSTSMSVEFRKIMLFLWRRHIITNKSFVRTIIMIFFLDIKSDYVKRKLLLLMFLLFCSSTLLLSSTFLISTSIKFYDCYG